MLSKTNIAAVAIVSLVQSTYILGKEPFPQIYSNKPSRALIVLKRKPKVPYNPVTPEAIITAEPEAIITAEPLSEETLDLRKIEVLD